MRVSGLVIVSSLAVLRVLGAPLCSPPLIPAAPERAQAPAPRVDRSLYGGGVAGGFELERSAYVAGEPMLLELAVDNLTALTLRFEDGRLNRAAWNLRNHLVIADERGQVLFDQDLDRPVCLGGRTHSVAVPPRATWYAVVTLNVVDEALLQPGRYRITATRELGEWLTTYPHPPRDDRVAELEITGEGTVLSTELTVDVLPYDRDRVARAIVEQRDALAALGYLSRLRLLRFLRRPLSPPEAGGETSRRDAYEAGFGRYLGWLERRIACGAERARSSELRPVLRSLPEELPASFCPGHGPYWRVPRREPGS